jgi:hypothetical protein
MLTLIKIIINLVIFLLIFRIFNIEFSLYKILLLTFINQIFETFKLTPQNIGLTESAFGLYFFKFGIDPIYGVYVKILHRIVEIFAYFSYYLVYKALEWKEAKKKFL